ASRVTYIQVVEPATTPTRPGLAQRLRSLGALALVGSLGFGTLLAVVLESFFPRRHAKQAGFAKEVDGEDGSTERRIRTRIRQRAPAHYATYHLNGTSAGRGPSAVAGPPTSGD